MLNDWRYIKKKVVPRDPPITGKITIENIKNIFEGNSDFRSRDIVIGNKTYCIIFIEGLVVSQIIDESILRPIIAMQKKFENSQDNTANNIDVLKKIEEGLIPHVSLNIRDDIKKVIIDILDGSLCFIDTTVDNKAITFDVRNIEKRSMSEPTNENIIKGSKEAFIEAFRTNISLIRVKLKTTDLKVKEIDVGNDIKTKVGVIYLQSVVDTEILNSVVDKIQKISTDKLLSVADFEEQIIDNKYSIFPQVLYTEKVDKVVSNIVEGKMALVIDGVPIVYVLPAVLNMFFQAPEDYAVNHTIATMIRIIRYVGTFTTLLLPAFYVSVLMYHQEMIPTDLAISIIKSKLGEPFPALVEVIFMLLSFEILIEASVRLPKTIGQTISIVGGLIIGEAAVNAKFVSPSVVVIIAIAGILGFLIPSQDLANAVRVCRLSLVILAGISGLFGLSIGLIAIIYYLCTLESFGIPYFVPFNANESENMSKDTTRRNLMLEMRNRKK